MIYISYLKNREARAYRIEMGIKRVWDFLFLKKIGKEFDSSNTHLYNP